MRLYLLLKIKWFSMIDKGIKKEDYREMSPYYQSRIGNNLNKITEVVFKNYNRQMIFKVSNIDVGSPNPEWTDNPNRIVYRIKLGERIK